MSTDSPRILASAPGTLMLLGEHAVLHGSQALVLAVDKRIRVELTPLQQPHLLIESGLGQYQAPLAQLDDHPDFGFVLAAVRQSQARLPSGLRLRIESDFSHLVGLGSSAAVTVAVVAALNRWIDPDADQEGLFEQARAVMLAVQGRGSGADLAAAVEGGMVAYHQSGTRQKLPGLPPIGLYYCGYKLKTPLVLAQVADAAEQMPELYQQLYRLMGRCAEQACEAASTSDWPQLGRLMNYYQGLMDTLGVNDAKLSAMVYALRCSEAVLGAKISGSGLGDCVISLGLPSELAAGFDVEAIPVRLSSRGVEVTTGNSPN